jgi:hypothetical protein
MDRVAPTHRLEATRPLHELLVQFGSSDEVAQVEPAYARRASRVIAEAASKKPIRRARHTQTIAH